MKIFSNFDTNFLQKLLQKKYQKYDTQDIYVIHRSRYYFIFKVLFPFSVLVALAGATCVFLLNHWLSYSLIPLSIVWIIVVWYSVIRKLLKYLYDFTVIDPQGITTYKQKGILRSTLKQIPANRIRTIQFERETILENIFEYGKIDIHTDFTDDSHIGQDDESPSVISMTYVDKPFETKNLITDICFR